MEKETFLSGYCRTIDNSRMVEVITEDGKLLEVDCCYDCCLHKPNCTIAQSIEELIKE
jgi:hypothetical protein